MDLQPHTADLFRVKLNHRHMGFSKEQLTRWLADAGFGAIRWHPFSPSKGRSKEAAMPIPELFALRRGGAHMMHIGIDFDDTLLDTRRVFVRILNGIRGTNHRLEDLHDYYLMGTFGCTSEYLESVFTQHFDELHAPEPFPGVQRTIEQLQSRGHAITIITARPAIHMPPLHQWLARHRLPGDRVISAPKSGEKALRAAEAKIDLFVDDNPRHALALAGRGIRVLLLDRPYNRACQDPLITRVPDWLTIRRILVPSVEEDPATLNPSQTGLLSEIGLCQPPQLIQKGSPCP